MQTSTISRWRAAILDRLARLDQLERAEILRVESGPVVRRLWLVAAGVVVLNTMIAGVISTATWEYTFFELWTGLNLLVFFVGLGLLSAWYGYRRYRGRLIRFILIGTILAVAGAFAGSMISDWMHGNDPFEMLGRRYRVTLLAGLSAGLLFAGTAALIAHFRNREFQLKTAALALEKRESELSRQLSESQLRLLQAQIEPHFLFNTLGSAQQLAEKRAPDAALLLGSLIRFLRAAVPNIRENSTTLERERQLIGAYLDIMQTRLVGRLRYRIDVPGELDSFRLPPGVLVTLVENAIKHGIEPLVEGGEIELVVRREGDRIRIRVADTGRGIVESTGSGGLGLANIQERLAAIYGRRAGLELFANEPRGFVAQLELPNG